MIRMGRNTSTTKPETPQQQQPEISNFDVAKTNQPFGFSSNNETSLPYRVSETTGTSRALTESEAIARDFKEGRLSGFVGSGTTLTGETEFKAMLRVDGHLIGKISSEAGTLHVGSGGQVDADINVAAAVIYGTVNGDIIATERIELGHSAKVIGNIQTPSLRIDTGAILEGNCSMMKPKADFDKRTIQNVVETVKTEKEPVAAPMPETVSMVTENAAVSSTK